MLDVFALSMATLLGALVGVSLTLLTDGALRMWAGYVVRLAKVMGATRALVAIATGRVQVSKLPEEERRWFKRAVGQLVAAERRVESLEGYLADYEKRAARTISELQADCEQWDRDLQAADGLVARHKADYENLRKVHCLFIDRESKLSQLILGYGLGEGLTLEGSYTVARRVLQCEKNDPDHGLGSCGCEVKA